MLRRLLIVVVPLLAVLFVALAIPLAWNIAQRETQSTYLDRLADAERFASLADDALSRGRTAGLAAELRRYSHLYGISVGVVAPTGELMLSSGPPLDLASHPIQRGVETALAGYRLNRIDPVLPWQSSPLVVVEPVGRDSGVVAAVVVVSPTDALRGVVVWYWGVLGAAALVAFLLVLSATIFLARWALRPVRDLDAATVALASGRLDARAGTLGGPPELRRFATSFNRMAEVVTQTLRRQRTFVGDASHQLRTPLASLRLAVENLEPYVSPDGRAAHSDALEETADMARIVDSLLALTRVEGAGPAASPQPLDAVVAAHRERWRQQLAAAGMTLEVELPAGLATYAPADALGQVLDELVGNAARLSGGTGAVVAASADDGHIEVHVRDDGRGLSAAELRHAGERFWRGTAHQNIAGTGMGLAICRELVTSWAGSLDLQPVRPHGLQARIVLPAAEA